MHHFLVDRGADARGKPAISLERRLASRVPNERLGSAVQIQRAHAGADLTREHQQTSPHDLGALADELHLVQLVDLDHRFLDPDAAQAAFPMMRWIAA